MWNTRIYYAVKPFIPRRLQIYIRRKFVQKKQDLYRSVWPVLPGSEEKPCAQFQWPESKQFALVLTHDVETDRGQAKCCKLADLEMSLGFRSSFNFVPERYLVSSEVRSYLVRHGFEVGVHGLKHDGKLYASYRAFHRRAQKINTYLSEWESAGFRSPAMHHNLEWIHKLNIQYDCSTFDTDPFEPQPDGAGTIFPFYVAEDSTGRGYVELPCTIPQDFTLFVLMRQTNINIWIKKLDWIVQNNGMALFNTHPDYMSFNHDAGDEVYSYILYKKMLEYIAKKYKDVYWNPLPKTMSDYVTNNLNKFKKITTKV